MVISKCKKCGCILPSDSNSKLCESCRLRKKERIRKGFAIVGAILLGILTLGGSVLGALGKRKK